LVSSSDPLPAPASSAGKSIELQFVVSTEKLNDWKKIVYLLID
jgi:hypothetical protein